MIDREKLEQCRKLKREAELAEERLREITPRITARTDFITRGSGKGSPTERAAVEMISLEGLLSAVVNERKVLIDEITAACQSLDSVLRSIIIYRYIDGMGWVDISEKMMYSESHLYELHRKAIREIERVSGG